MQKSIQSSSRTSYLNYIRLFATFAVIILHCTYTYYNNPTNSSESLWRVLGYLTELTRTGVPLFFMISGYLLLNKEISSVSAFYKKRIIKIGIPFVLYDVFYFFYMNLSSGSAISIKGFFDELMIQGSSYHLWFVYSILFIYLLMPFLQKIVKSSNEKQLFLLLCLAVFQTTLRPFINTIFAGKIYLQLTDDGFMGYIGYIILGYILGKYGFSKRTNITIYIVGALFFVLTPIFSMKSVVNSGEFLFAGGYSLNHYIEAAAIFVFCKNHISRPSKAVSALSSVSFSAYLIHIFVLEELKHIPLNFSTAKAMAFLCIATIVLSFIWAFAEHFIVSFTKKSIINITKKRGSNEKQVVFKN